MLYQVFFKLEVTATAFESSQLFLSFSIRRQKSFRWAENFFFSREEIGEDYKEVGRE
jgi:hypothetical protein